MNLINICDVCEQRFNEPTTKDLCPNCGSSNWRLLPVEDDSE